MAENGSYSLEPYTGQIFIPENAQFINRALGQIILRKFDDTALESLTSLETAMAFQIATLNHPYMWQCIHSTYKLPIISEDIAREISAMNVSLIGDINNFAIKGILWGSLQLDNEAAKSSYQKKAIFDSVKRFEKPITTLDEVAKRTEFVIGTTNKRGSLDKALNGILKETMTPEQHSLMDILRIYGRSFAQQLP